jgi:hypothetical protein
MDAAVVTATQRTADKLCRVTTAPQWNPAATGTNRAFARRDFTSEHSDLRWASSHCTGEAEMGFIKGGLLWLAGIPLPFILLLALFLHPG